MGVAPKIYPKMKEYSEEKIVRISKWMIVFWGVVLAALGCMFSFVQAQGLLSLGFKMPGYVYGILIGVALLAYAQGAFGAILVGSVLSVSFILWFNAVGVSSFWWYPCGALIVILTALIDHPKT